MLSMIGLIGGLALLIYLTMRGMNLLVVGPLSALFVALLAVCLYFRSWQEKERPTWSGTICPAFRDLSHHGI